MKTADAYYLLSHLLTAIRLCKCRVANQIKMNR